jgi:type II secretory pathway component PulF
MLSAGVPMIRSLAVLSESAGFRRHRRILRRMREEVERGATLGESLVHARRWIPRLDREVLSVGEQTGRLEATLQLLAGSSRQHAALLSDVISGAMYPLLVLHMALLVFPISLIVDMALNGQYMAFLTHKLRVFGVFYAALFFLFRIAPRVFGGRIKAVTEFLTRPVPVLGRALRELSLARLAFALDVQLSSGIGVIEAWMRAATVCGSPALRRTVHAWQWPLANGATPGELLGRTRAFRGVFSEYYMTGEMSGKLEDSLHRIHEHYEHHGRARMKTLAEWTPRLLYFGVVLYAAYFVYTFYRDYFNMLNEFL